MYKFWLTAIVLSFTTFQGFAQDLGNSPYSQAGIGDLRLSTSASQQAMPGSASNYSSVFFLNTVNPALVGRLSKTKTTIFEAGAITQYKHLKQNENAQRDFGGSLDYLQLGVPISNKLGAAIGLTPYSSANSQNVLSQMVDRSNFLSDVIYKREGGLNNAFIALGYDFASMLNVDSLRNRVMLGVKANYTFGSVIDQTISQIIEGTNQTAGYQANLYRRTTYSDITLETGLTYTRRFGKDYKLHMGALAQLGGNVRSKRLEMIRMEVLDNSDFIIDSDTLKNNTDGIVSLPQRYIAGLTFEREYRWAVSAEAGWQDWGKFTSFGETTSFNKSFAAGIGIQWLPDFFSVSKGFWRRSIFRAGFQWEQTPLVFKGQKIQDASIRLGTSIPFGRAGGILTLGLAGGRKGTLSESLVRETYLRGTMGITINDRWFVKPKFD